MSNTLIQIKRSSVPGKVPNTSVLSTGELAINLSDRKLYSSDGSNIFELATAPDNITPGYYGSFYDDSATQTAPNNTTAYPILIGGSYGSNGVTVQNGSEIKFIHSGVYNIQFSIQFANHSSNFANVNVWFRLNGVDIVNSGGQSTVPNRHGSINGQIIASWNLVDTFAAGDVVQLMWQPETTDVFLETIPLNTTPPGPVSPAIIVTVTQVSDILSTSAKATVNTPANNAVGTPGQIVVDGDYIYICTATNTWKRAALTVY